MIDAARILRHGHDLAEVRYPYRVRTDRDAMWCLLIEALRTSARFPSPPRTGYPALAAAFRDAPDEVTWFHRVLEALQGRGDLHDASAGAPRIMPDAATVSRADLILRLWHGYALRQVGNWRTLRAALVAKALGAHNAEIRARTGLSRQSIGNAQTRAMRDMLEALKQEAQPVVMRA